MKKTNIFSCPIFIIAFFIFQACSQETPFNVESGVGSLKMSTQLRSDFTVSTRGDIQGYENDSLDNKLVVYIENEKGVIRKFLGRENLPNLISLPLGNYVIEGWTGDSVSASWDKKFFRGYEKVEVGLETSMTLMMNIANVMVDVDPTALDLEIENLNIKVFHSRGERVFTADSISDGKRAYFMMPNADKDINYEITGVSSDGEGFKSTGKIENVERAHLYHLILSSEEVENTEGGALIKIEIEDVPVLNVQYEILPPPSFSLLVGGSQVNLSEPIISTTQDFQDVSVKIVSFEALNNLSLKFGDNFQDDLKSVNGSNLITDILALQTLSQYKITLEHQSTSITSNLNGNIKVEEALITFPKSFLDGLEISKDGYSIELLAKDHRYTNSVNIRIENQKDPITSEEISGDYGSPIAILATSAEIPLSVNNTDASDYGIMYRELNSGNFEKVSAKLTRATDNSVTIKLTGLQPGTTYEYKAYADEFEEENTKTFQTEGKYQIPNYNMEEWSLDKNSKKDNAYIAGPGETVTFWDSGNHGSMTMDVNLTTPNTDFQNGNTVAQLKSQYVNLWGIGKFAAGNLFVGEFGKTVGTSGAQLKFGRPYNGSHPSALKVNVNYRPGTVDYSEVNDLKKGETDQGQIYVALATSQFDIDTGTANKKVFFNKDADIILAYGEVTWDSEVGENNSLQTITIPIEYYDRAKTKEATHLIIVCSASKYGDYFTGSSTSVMYLDDFELEYGDIQWAK